MNSTPLEVTPALLRRHDRPTPRYTSYPTADRFHPGFDAGDYAAALRRTNAQDTDRPLGLYAHLPFCHHMCTYCGCHVVVTQKDDKKADYLSYLTRELDLVADYLPNRRSVAQLHLGGGTPNSYTPAQLGELLAAVGQHFELTPDAEVAIEIDPRRASDEQIHALADLGFNRISMGVQDFDRDVQQAIGRVQPFSVTEAALTSARRHGFLGINIDLVYGLPHQTAERFEETILQALTLEPDRVALYSFAYIPKMRPHQRRIDPASLPSPDEKLALFCAARRAFLSAGYAAIGMDHFARPGDPLARALDEGQLHRNFQGYTVKADELDTIGFGVSSIGALAGAYAQNHKKLHGYKEALDAGLLPTERGYRLDGDDLFRRWLIEQLMCGFELRYDEVSARWGRDLRRELPEVRERLALLAEEGLIDLNAEGIFATDVGRLFIRVVGAAFDRHLHASPDEERRYSRAV